MTRFLEGCERRLDNKQYHLRYLPVFAEDLEEAVSYILKQLHNPSAAEKLIEDTEKAILERLRMPCAFQPYFADHPRKHPYYCIRIRNFSVFYVVIDDVMEVRRFIYNKRDINRLLP